MEEVDKMIDELRLFSSEVAELNDPVNQETVSIFERVTGISLPTDYKYAISQVNGFSIMGDEVYGLKGANIPSSIEVVYYIEHNEVLYPQPTYLVPFSPDGGGNFYCFDTRFKSLSGNSCPVVFWTSNYNYTSTDIPEITNDSFVDFVNEVIIGWTLEKYDYEGNEK